MAYGSTEASRWSVQLGWSEIWYHEHWREHAGVSEQGGSEHAILLEPVYSNCAQQKGTGGSWGKAIQSTAGPLSHSTSHNPIKLACVSKMAKGMCFDHDVIRRLISIQPDESFTPPSSAEKLPNVSKAEVFPVKEVHGTNVHTGPATSISMMGSSVGQNMATGFTSTQNKRSRKVSVSCSLT